MPSTMVIFLYNFYFIPGMDLIQFSSYTHDLGTQKQWEEMPRIMVIFYRISIPSGLDLIDNGIQNQWEEMFTNMFIILELNIYL